MAASASSEYFNGEPRSSFETSATSDANVACGFASHAATSFVEI